MYVDLREDWCLQGVGVEIWQPPLSCFFLIEVIYFSLASLLRLKRDETCSGSAPVQ